jgi:hypothetical protein
MFILKLRGSTFDLSDNEGLRAETRDARARQFLMRASHDANILDCS